MSFLSRSAFILAKGSISLIGLAGVAAILAAPASAQNASISGAITRTTPGGFVTSISGEMVAPAGIYFTGPLTVTGTADPVEPTLTIDAEQAVTPASGSLSLLEGTVAESLMDQDLSTQMGIDAYAAILKAAVGADGLESTGGSYYEYWD